MKQIFELRLGRRVAVAAFLVAVVTACAPPVDRIISEQVRSSDQRAIARGKVLLEEHLRFVARLRSEGDPLGDYLWTRAHADGWIENAITDPIRLKKMYEEAAARGSVDAKHVLGLMLIFGGASQTSGANPKGPVLEIKDRDSKRGMSLIEAASKEQCWYWTPYLAGVSGTRCLVPEVSATQIWPEFRDGHAFPNDDVLARYWREKRDQCRVLLQKRQPIFLVRDDFPVCK